MCGIFGYLGGKDASKIIFEGLKNLEYRGYDSWGIVVKNKDGKLLVEKRVGQIGKANISFNQSNIGLGHTRWATHGKVSTKNAHPHFDCTGKIAVVHNGIVENYQELKGNLIKKGHKFTSQTDTEVIAHLVEENYQGDLSQALRLAFRKLLGLNAIVVLDTKKEILAAVKNGSPLVIGMADDQVFISSDAFSLYSHTKRVIFLGESQIALAGKDGIVFSDLSGRIEKPKIEILKGKREEISLGRFPHFMLKEIFEQPKVLTEIASNTSQNIIELARAIENSFGTFMVGCGTASYAALAGQYLFSRVALRHVNFSIGSEFAYWQDYLTPRSLVIALSQSGETMDTLESCYLAKEKRTKIVALVNVLGSTLYRISDYKILLGAGPEKAVCATKSFLAMLAVLLLLSYQMVGKRKIACDLILKSAKNISKILQKGYLAKIQKLAKKIAKHEHVYVIGRGLSYPIAQEAALKIKEVSYIHSEGFAGGELKHGVIALIEKGTPCIVFAPNDETQGAILSNAEELKARGGFIIGIAPKNDKVFDYFLPVDDLSCASILVDIVPAQLVAYFLALEKGYDPDRPRNLAKSVTVK
jgi:glucosamine--fructose-6-phosphate aminotransferase (isomerizing)